MPSRTTRKRADHVCGCGSAVVHICIQNTRSPFPYIIVRYAMSRYLSAEQRKNYLVKIDDRGRIRWARNGELVDTHPNQWKDSEGGQGIVPLDGTEDRAVEHRLRRQVSTLSGGPSTSSSSSSINAMDQAQHYSGNPSHGKIRRAFASRFTSKGITERLLKKTVKKNTWIYAAVSLIGHIPLSSESQIGVMVPCRMRNVRSNIHSLLFNPFELLTFVKYQVNLFVGMKHTGTFQHSSLTGGGLITSAGYASSLSAPCIFFSSRC